MSEVIAELDFRVVDEDGREYFVNVAAEPTVDGRWEGWLEFLPLDDSEPLLTGTETTQTTRADVAYWAGGLTQAYVEGAFTRATFAGEAAGVRVAATLLRTIEPVGVSTALDPFHILPLGKEALRLRLRSLTRTELLTIIAVYDLNPARVSLAWLSDSQLVTFIVTATEMQALQGRR